MQSRFVSIKIRAASRNAKSGSERGRIDKILWRIFACRGRNEWNIYGTRMLISSSSMYIQIDERPRSHCFSPDRFPSLLSLRTKLKRLVDGIPGKDQDCIVIVFISGHMIKSCDIVFVFR